MPEILVIVLIFLLALAALYVLLRLTGVLVLSQVIGTSMYPTYKHKEIVFATMCFSLEQLKRGDVIGLVNPLDGRMNIKRIYKITGPLIFVRGDNEVSVDSRKYGPLVKSKKVILYKILFAKEKQYE